MGEIRFNLNLHFAGVENCLFNFLRIEITLRLILVYCFH
jgi:hypothetical protein